MNAEYVQQFINSLAISDKIQIVGIFSTTLLSVISVLIAISTLRQNSKMIEESTRPYIVISFEAFTTGPTERGFFVIKNYGQSAAIVTKFEFSNDLTTISQKIDGLGDAYDTINQAHFAPGQRILIPFSPKSKLSEYSYQFKIEYKTSANKIYKDTFDVNLKIAAKIPSARNNPDKQLTYENLPQLLRDISFSLQELNERQL